MTHLILLPGMDGTGALFAPVIAIVAELMPMKVIRYPTSGAQNYATLEQFTRVELPASEPYVILGESFSGPIAICLAATAGSNLKGLILCCTFARNPMPWLEKASEFIRFAPVQFASNFLIAEILFGKSNDRKNRHMLAQALASLSPQGMRERLKAALEVDVSEKLLQIQVPMMYIQGQQDRVVPQTSFKTMQQLRPDLQCRTINGQHCLLQAKPAEAADIIIEFIRSIESSNLN